MFSKVVFMISVCCVVMVSVGVLFFLVDVVIGMWLGVGDMRLVLDVCGLIVVVFFDLGSCVVIMLIDKLMMVVLIVMVFRCQVCWLCRGLVWICIEGVCVMQDCKVLLYGKVCVVDQNEQFGILFDIVKFDVVMLVFDGILFDLYRLILVYWLLFCVVVFRLMLVRYVLIGKFVLWLLIFVYVFDIDCVEYVLLIMMFDSDGLLLVVYVLQFVFIMIRCFMLVMQVLIQFICLIVREYGFVFMLMLLLLVDCVLFRLLLYMQLFVNRMFDMVFWLMLFIDRLCVLCSCVFDIVMLEMLFELVLMVMLLFLVLILDCVMVVLVRLLMLMLFVFLCVVGVWMDIFYVVKLLLFFIYRFGCVVCVSVMLQMVKFVMLFVCIRCGVLVMMLLWLFIVFGFMSDVLVFVNDSKLVLLLQLLLLNSVMLELMMSFVLLIDRLFV